MFSQPPLRQASNQRRDHTRGSSWWVGYHTDARRGCRPLSRRRSRSGSKVTDRRGRNRYLHQCPWDSAARSNTHSKPKAGIAADRMNTTPTIKADVIASLLIICWSRAFGSFSELRRGTRDALHSGVEGNCGATALDRTFCEFPLRYHAKRRMSRENGARRKHESVPRGTILAGDSAGNRNPRRVGRARLGDDRRGF